MGKDIEKRVDPAVQQLRQSLAAIERAMRSDYAPHVTTCMTAALDHANRALRLIQRTF